MTIPGGGRYALALVVDALGAGLLRPFLLLYAIGVLGMPVGPAGAALSVGLLVGLGTLPLLGRWLDRGARSWPVAVTLLVRAVGVVVLLAAHGPAGFVVAAVLLGLGNQAWPAAHAAVVATLADGRVRDAALAAGRSLRNAGLGAGALIATVAVAGGTGTLRGLAAVTAVAYLAAAVLVLTMRLRAHPAGVRRHPGADPGADPPADPPGAGPTRRLTLLGVANLPYALCFAVLEVALPALVVTRLHASPSWSAAMFVANTVLVITTQVAAVVWLARRSRRAVLAGSGLVLAASYAGFWGAGTLGGNAGAAALAAVSLVYTAGEILYAGSGTALVIAASPGPLLGRALARWQFSTGLGQAVAPAVLTALLAAGPAALWGGLAGATTLAAVAVHRWAPAEPDRTRHPADAATAGPTAESGRRAGPRAGRGLRV